MLQEKAREHTTCSGRNWTQALNFGTSFILPLSHKSVPIRFYGPLGVFDVFQSVSLFLLRLPCMVQT